MPVSKTAVVTTYRNPNLFGSAKKYLLALTLTALSGCDGFTAAPVEFSQADIEVVGDVSTLELQGRVVTSLPRQSIAVDEKQAELGRLLFWDPILSGGRDVSCATCHLPEFAYTDSQPRSIGASGNGRGTDRQVGHIGKVSRNAQTVLNTVWNGIDEFGVYDPATAPMFWDNRAASLEEQAIEPIESREEMRGDHLSAETIHPEIESRINSNATYRSAFSEAFGIDTIRIDDVARALAVFQSTLIANNSPFDRWMRGEADAMTQQQVSGMQEFVIAGCADCHSGPLFSDFDTHILALQEGVGLETADEGDGSFAFRTPTLRQLEFTAPYFHAGQFSTLGAAIEFYDEPRRSSNPAIPSSSLDPELLEVPEMDGGRAAVIISFLKALNDESFDRLIPDAVPSGLPVGGFTASE